MEKNILLDNYLKSNNLQDALLLYEDLKQKIPSNTNIIELNNLFNYPISNILYKISDQLLNENKYQECINFHLDLFSILDNNQYLSHFYHNLALATYHLDTIKGFNYFNELLTKYPYDYEIMDSYFSCLYQEKEYEVLKTMITKYLPLSVEYNVETKMLINHVSEYLKNIDSSLANEYASIKKRQDQFGRKKPTNVIKIGRNDPCPCGSGKKYKKCCGK